MRYEQTIGVLKSFVYKVEDKRKFKVSCHPMSETFRAFRSQARNTVMLKCQVSLRLSNIYTNTKTFKDIIHNRISKQSAFVYFCKQEWTIIFVCLDTVHRKGEGRLCAPQGLKEWEIKRERDTERYRETHWALGWLAV